MKNKEDKLGPQFIIDIHKYPVGNEIELSGKILKKKKFQNAIRGLWLQDITGVVLVLLDEINDPVVSSGGEVSIHIGTHIKVLGEIGINSRGNRVINKISLLEVLFSTSTKFSELDSELHEHAARMLMSRICNNVRELMKNAGFIEFLPRVISNHWKDEGLEPMQVLYPGFGSPAYLTPSPSAQVVEFLTASLVPRAFAVSISFTQSYRFPHSASETQVIVAKATDLDEEKHIALFEDISKRILKQFVGNMDMLLIPEGKWPHTINGVDRNALELKGDLNLVKFSANIPVIGANWDTQINTIFQLVDKDKNILAEGTRECLTEEVTIASITIYPSEFCFGLIISRELVLLFMN